MKWDGGWDRGRGGAFYLQRCSRHWLSPPAPSFLPNPGASPYCNSLPRPGWQQGTCRKTNGWLRRKASRHLTAEEPKTPWCEGWSRASKRCDSCLAALISSDHLMQVQASDLQFQGVRLKRAFVPYLLHTPNGCRPSRLAREIRSSVFMENQTTIICTSELHKIFFYE